VERRPGGAGAAFALGPIEAQAGNLSDRPCRCLGSETAAGRQQGGTTMSNATSRPAGRDTAAEAELNEQFQTLLRDAADTREGRARTHTTQDAAAAAEESRALFALARSLPKQSPVLTVGSRARPAANGRTARHASE
jgi:hypothetical protein